jgi:carboxymethylenebutenolidase
MKTETLTFSTARGETTAYVAAPDEETGKFVIVIHEYWGLNDNIKNIADRYADAGFTAIAPDLYLGKVASNPQEAGELMSALALEDGLDTIKNAIALVQEKYEALHIGITGFCMGGTYALQAVCHLEGLNASAPFYGDIPDESTLQKLKTPVLFISGKKDKWITPERVREELELVAKNNLLPVESVAYDADHAFFNDKRPEVFDPEAAKDAWKRVVAFFNENLAPKEIPLNIPSV